MTSYEAPINDGHEIVPIWNLDSRTCSDVRKFDIIYSNFSFYFSDNCILGPYDESLTVVLSRDEFSSAWSKPKVIPKIRRYLDDHCFKACPNNRSLLAVCDDPISQKLKLTHLSSDPDDILEDRIVVEEQHEKIEIKRKYIDAVTKEEGVRTTIYQKVINVSNK